MLTCKEMLENGVKKKEKPFQYQMSEEEMLKYEQWRRLHEEAEGLKIMDDDEEEDLKVTDDEA
jgi:hypothetical protein